MKRVLLVLLCAIVWLGAAAQNTKNVLEINQSSFRPVQTDVLKGVTIDAINVDRSKRPCARIKMHVNRMTREEIDQIAVKTVGGMVELTKRITAAEGNGIIFELTAKPETRFYIHHDKYGDSNEVMVNLEGNKEYRIDAQLNLLLSITIVSNVQGADVYVDNVYKGQTNDSYMLTVEDIVPGNHKIALKYGASTSEKSVDVNSGNISFRVEVNTATSRPQYVVFEVEPKSATVFIDNEPQTAEEGFVTTVLQNGNYSWRVVAKGYHEQSGSFVVSGEKVKQVVKLIPDAATVTITTESSSEIWINNAKKGVGLWKGQLLAGTYIFEARKAGHRTTTLAQTITSTQPEQHYTLDAPKPILGTLDISSTPAGANVTVDGKTIGETPLYADILVGEHMVGLSKDGYEIWRGNVTIAEGQTTTVSVTITKDEATSATPATPASQVASSKTYKVGDYYNENGKEGVIFWVDPSGKHGKIVSLTESSSKLEWSSDDAEQSRLIGADDRGDGAKNMAIVKQIPGWQSKYPAFKWCADLGEGWYLPAMDELMIFTPDNKTIHDAVNQTLKTKGKKLANGFGSGYWSSTEYRSGLLSAWLVDFFRGGAGTVMKNSDCYVRAVAAVTFGESESKTTSSASATSASQVASSKTYKVGDYYNENGKKGVVFWVDPSGKHGKIVSLTESSSGLQWSSSKKEQKRLIGAEDKVDGAKNMAVVKQIPGWQSKYPAFKWCADLGEGWYLPAIDELKIFMFDNTVHNAVNQTLETKGKKMANKGDYRSYLSSTEFAWNSAWYVNMYDGLTNIFDKYYDYYVRAVAAVTFGESESKTASPASATSASQVASSKTYKVGDYYNENGKKGVVFWVDRTGKHGKIVSLKEGSNLRWASDTAEKKRLIGADDENDGANNMAKVMQIPDWESKYPAFKWCADLGEGWYLPAIDELKKFTLYNTVYNAVNRTLETKGKKLANRGDMVWYWSSTERNRKYKGKFSAWSVLMYDGTTNYPTKGYGNYVRAVATF